MQIDSMPLNLDSLKQANRHLMRLIISLFILVVSCIACLAQPSEQFSPSKKSQHGLSMHGEPQLPEGFTHLPYVNPQAPKGGRFRLGAQGTFDSLNPFNIRGVAAGGVTQYVFESLMARSWDEPFSLYGLIAERVHTNEDRSEVTFFLNPKARFSDGVAITAEVVHASFELLKTKGRPNHRQYYNRVERVEKPSAHTIKFIFKNPDRELPLILGLMPVIGTHTSMAEKFEETWLGPITGSGPYAVSHMTPGKSLHLTRRSDYWGEDLAVNKGRFNFEQIRFDYYLDNNSLFEAFKTGLYDARSEPNPNSWHKEYDFPKVQQGEIKRESFGSGLPKPVYGFAFNMRRSPYSDKRIREALNLLFDAAWINKNLFSNGYGITESYFHGSELSSLGQVISEEEMKILGSAKDNLAKNILEGKPHLPRPDGSGRDRSTARMALERLKNAGFIQKDGKMVSQQTGQPLSPEILVTSRDQEQIAIAYRDHLRRVGIEARVRMVDTAQYEGRRQNFDFDMTPIYLPGSASPGMEQTFRWGSAAASQTGSFNFSGLTSKNVDNAIEQMVQAKDRKTYIAATRALDRLLINEVPVLLHYHLPASWVAVSSKIGFPESTPLFGYAFDTWWHKAPEKP